MIENKIDLIEQSVKKHMGFALIIAFVPLVFIQIISYFSGSENTASLLVFLMPVVVLSACAHLLKSVLGDLARSEATATDLSD